jgi:uncharacterized protein (DUF952 family)
VTIFKIVPAALWAEAEPAGRFTGSPADAQDGFIHFSTAVQVRETAAKHFAGVHGLQLFPHLYEDLPMSAVKWAMPLPIGPDGRHQFPPRLD